MRLGHPQRASSVADLFYKGDLETFEWAAIRIDAGGHNHVIYAATAVVAVATVLGRYERPYQS